jgi:hypothetical protein
VTVDESAKRAGVFEAKLDKAQPVVSVESQRMPTDRDDACLHLELRLAAAFDAQTDFIAFAEILIRSYARTAHGKIPKEYRVAIEAVHFHDDMLVDDGAWTGPRPANTGQLR